jgi:hypothetical protein
MSRHSQFIQLRESAGDVANEWPSRNELLRGNFRKIGGKPHRGEAVVCCARSQGTGLGVHIIGKAFRVVQVTQFLRETRALMETRISRET